MKKLFLTLGFLFASIPSLFAGSNWTVDINGNAGFSSGNKFYVDGAALTGDTYFSESSANVFTITSGATAALAIRSSSIAIPATNKVFFDGVGASGDTYWYEKSANVLVAVAGGSEQFGAAASGLGLRDGAALYFDGVATTGDTGMYQPSNNNVKFFSNSLTVAGYAPAGMGVEATYHLWLDGNGDTYWIESAGNTAELYIGGSSIISGTTSVLNLNASTNVNISAANLLVSSGRGIYLDGGTNDYWVSSGNGQNDLYAAGTLAIRTNSSGEVLLANVNPPTANYANRNSIVKGWANVSSAGACVASYNVTSCVKNSTGNYTVTWETDFASANYAVSCSIVGSGAAMNACEPFGFGTGSVSIETFNAPSGVGGDLAFSIIAIGTQ